MEILNMAIVGHGYVGKAVDTLVSERVSVEWKEHEGEDKILLYTKESDE